MCCVCVELDGMSGGGKDIAVLAHRSPAVPHGCGLLCHMAVAMHGYNGTVRWLP